MIKYVPLLLCLTLPVFPALSWKDVCLLPMHGGSCRSRYLSRWYFNTWYQRCQPFLFTCGGNANNFATKEECRETCTPDICTLPKDPGTSGELCIRTTRYYYWTFTETCEEFKYNGCQGNENNFVSKLECWNVCMNK